MAIKNKILILTGLALTLTSLAIYVYRQYDLLYSYCYKFKKWNIVQLGLKRVILEPILKVYNISDFGFYLTGYKFDIYVNNKFVSKVYSNKMQYLNPNGESKISFMIDFEPKKLFKNVNAELILGLLDPSKLIIKLKGVVSARSGIITVRNIYIELEDSLKNWLAADPDAEYVCP